MKQLIKQMEEYAVAYNVPIIQKEGLEVVQKCIVENDVQTILEVGTAIGYSAIQMCQMNENIQVVSIERDPIRYAQAVQNVKEANLSHRITLYEADALEIEIEGVFDLIFIDAAKAQYVKFFEKYEKNLTDSGIILSDNLSFHGFVDTKDRIQNRNTRQLVQKIRKYITFLQEHPNYKTTFYEQGDGVAISKKISSN